MTLNVLNYQQADQAGYQEDVAIWQKFQADNPDITLNMEVLFNDPYHQKLEAYAAAGTLPDVFYLWPGARSAVIHEQHLAKDLTKLLGADFLGNFSAAAVNPDNQLGKYLAELPQSFTYTSVMYVNKKLLADNGFGLPKTFADLRRMVPRLKAKGIAVIMLPDKDGWPMQSCLFSTVAGRMAGDKFFDAIVAGKAKFTDKPFVDALDVIANLYKDGIIARSDDQVGYGEGAGLFASGKAAIYIDGDWRVQAYITDKASGKALIDPKAQESDFALLPFVSIPEKKSRCGLRRRRHWVGYFGFHPRRFGPGEGGGSPDKVSVLARGPGNPLQHRRLRSHPQGSQGRCRAPRRQGPALLRRQSQDLLRARRRVRSLGLQRDQQRPRRDRPGHVHPDAGSFRCPESLRNLEGIPEIT